ncbi:sensor histidine kinase [Paenibacillus sp. CAU 1782]
MSVKRRLYLSNFLMLVLPIVLMIAAGVCFILIYVGITGFRDAPPFKHGDIMMKRMEKVKSLAASWGTGENRDVMKADIDAFNRDNEGLGLTLSLYDGQTLVYPATLPQNRLSGLDLTQDDQFMLVTDTLSVFRIKAGPYGVVLTDTNFTVDGSNKSRQQLYIGLVSAVLLVIVVIATNRALTKFVFRGIMNPIHILSHGVHQLRDGNLTYRIHYDKQDEFASVCADFNEMAQHLYHMVNERQRDENNRRELIAGISHDLRTPLTSIKAYLEGIEKGVAATPQMQRKYFDIIKNKTASLEHLINQLFLFSKLDLGEFPLHLEAVDMGRELRQTMAAFAAEYEPKGLTIQVDDAIPHAEVIIDVVQFRNVIQNILENSLKYRNKEQGKIVVTAMQEEDRIKLKLSDNGPGVAPDELEKLFDVFYRSDASRKTPDLGSGLGLAISVKIIQRLGGDIKAELAPTEGLSIIITLPKHSGTEGAEHEKNSNY